MNFVRTASVWVTLLAMSSLPGLAAAKTEINPEALKLSRDILVATHANALGDQLMTQLIKAFGNGINQVNPGKGKEVEDLMEQVFVPEFRKSMPQLLDQSAQIYALNFSVDELKQILDFYNSEIGRKMVDRMPEILREQSEMSQVFMRTIMPGIQSKILEALKARGLKQPNNI